MSLNELNGRGDQDDDEYEYEYDESETQVCKDLPLAEAICDTMLGGEN